MEHTKKPRRKPLETWQLEDAQRLKGLYEQAQAGALEKFGARHNIGSQALVWQYLNGHIPLNLKVAVKFAVGLGCAVGDFSPRLAEQLPTDVARREGFEDLVRELPINEAQQVLDFISYKFERSEDLVASEAMARYNRWVERIAKDLEARRKADGS